MSYKVVVCDDELLNRMQLRNYFARFESETAESFIIYEYDTVKSLLEEIPDDIQLILLDIGLGEDSGIDAAKEIRKRNKHVCIMFVTSLPQFALDSFTVHPFSFLVKPVSYAEFKRELIAALNDISNKRGKTIGLQYNSITDIYSTKSILYAEVIGRELIIHTEKQTKSYNYPMHSFEQMVDGCGFFRCHKSFIVNFLFISKVGNDYIILANGDRIPLSKYRKSEFLDAFSNYIGTHIL